MGRGAAAASSAAEPVVVGVGQCGVAVVGAWWAERAAAAKAAGAAPPPPLPVLVDAEPKALRSAVALAPALADAAAVAGASGRGNNFAKGYAAAGPARDEGGVLGGALAALRAELERREACPDVVVVGSLAGGTGSGLGAALVEATREAYPELFVVCVAVAPRPEGETPCQALNAVLAVQHLQHNADAVLLFGNAPALAAAQRQRGEAAGVRDVNAYIGACVAGALAPLARPGGGPMLPAARELVLHVTPEPSCKFAEAYTAPWGAATKAATTTPWAELVTRGVLPLAPRHDALDAGRPVSATASLLALRGPGAADGAAGAAAALRGARHAFPHAAWQPPPAAVVARWSPAPAGPSARAATVVSNRSSAAGALSHLAGRAGALVRAGAYVHWYERHGFGAGALEDAVSATLDVADAYRRATEPTL